MQGSASCSNSLHNRGFRTSKSVLCYAYTYCVLKTSVLLCLTVQLQGYVFCDRFVTHSHSDAMERSQFTGHVPTAHWLCTAVATFNRNLYHALLLQNEDRRLDRRQL